MLISLGPAAVAVADEIQFVGLSGEDVEKAEALRKIVTPKITSIHHFRRNSSVDPDVPPIGVYPGDWFLVFTQPLMITVYEIKDRGEQDKVIAAVQAVVREQKLKRVDLQFMDHENWIAHGNIGERGPELQLRRVRISQNSFQEEGGPKTITYPW